MTVPPPAGPNRIQRLMRASGAPAPDRPGLIAYERWAGGRHIPILLLEPAQPLG